MKKTGGYDKLCKQSTYSNPNRSRGFNTYLQWETKSWQSVQKLSKQLLLLCGHWTNLVYNNTPPKPSPGVLFVPWPGLNLVSIQPSLIVTLQCEGCFHRWCLSGASAVSNSFILCFKCCNLKPQSLNGVPYYYKYLAFTAIYCVPPLSWFRMSAFLQSVEFMSKWTFFKFGSITLAVQFLPQRRKAVKACGVSAQVPTPGYNINTDSAPQSQPGSRCKRCLFKHILKSPTSKAALDIES